MANEEHVRILKQGVEAWNHWRKGNPGILPDLSEATLGELIMADGELLSGEPLKIAQYRGIDLCGIDLHGADLRGANLSRMDLQNADLAEAFVSETDFTGANLAGTDFTGAMFARTKLIDVDLSQTRGLDHGKHYAPSYVGIDTVYRSRGNLPERFMLHAGVPGTFVTYARSLVGTPVEFYSSFISYSGKDHPFAERLHADLQQKGVRCWFAPEDMKIGDRIRVRIDESIRLYDKLLLVLSQHALSSVWVADEVEAAMEKERRQGKMVLFPITLDNAVWDSEEAWAAKVRREHHIGDFRYWKEHDAYQAAFKRLIRDLKAETADGK